MTTNMVPRQVEPANIRSTKTAKSSLHRRYIFSLTWMFVLKELHIEGCRVREKRHCSVMKTHTPMKG
jgi:hypothetical protein